MDHEPVLISTIAVGLVAAFVGGFIAKRIGLPTIVGYIVAGVVLGPFTPGFIADTAIALELADIGIILLMFGVGIHFSLRDLAAVRAIAIPGALIQIVVATLLGLMLGVALGWGIGGGLVLGLALSVASTVVLLRAITDRGELDTLAGPDRDRLADRRGPRRRSSSSSCCRRSRRSSAGPRTARTDSLGTLGNIALALGKAALFVVVMVVAGTRLVPRLLTLVANEGSKELFTLAVLAIALGIAFLSSAVFGVSFALGAFLAGAVVGESDMSHQAAADALPAPRRVRRPLLRVGRDAARPGHPDRDAAGDRGRRPPGRRRQGARQVRDRRACSATRSGWRLTVGGRPRPDRRVLVHPGHRRPVARASSRPRGSSSSSPGRCCRSRSTRCSSITWIRSRRGCARIR